MRLFSTVLSGYFLIVSLFSCAQQAAVDDTVKQADSLIAINWKNLAPGVDFCETDAPYKSIVNDSKLTVLRIDPKAVEFEMFCATQMDKRSRTVTEWADSFRLNIVFNAGMYDLAHKLISRGYLKNHEHINKGTSEPNFKSAFVFHPQTAGLASCDIVDLQCSSWDKVQKQYHVCAQGLRMLDCEGEPIGWNKRRQSCSMLVAAKDPDGNIWLVFTRSPYVHNEFIAFLRKFPVKLTHAIYLEGGPETSLLVRSGETVIEKVGSYVSQTYENDENDHFWALPNVIGIRFKQE